MRQLQCYAGLLPQDKLKRKILYRPAVVWGKRPDLDKPVLNFIRDLFISCGYDHRRRHNRIYNTIHSRSGKGENRRLYKHAD